MKTWITYLAAIGMGFAANLLLGDIQLFNALIGPVASVLLNLGMFMLFPLVFVLFSAGVSSLRRQGETPLLVSSTLLWSLVSTLVLSLVGAGVSLLLQPTIPAAGAPVSGTAELLPLVPVKATEFFALLIGRNSFSSLVVTDQLLLPMIFLALLLGLALKPDQEYIRPAYVVLNSFAEAMVRLAVAFTFAGAVFMGFISCNWFVETDALALVLGHGRLFASLGISVAAIILVVLPLLFFLFSGLRGGSPYMVLLGAASSLLAGFFTGNILYGTTSLIAVSRRNNDVGKRIAGTAIPIHTLIARGGSAMTATIVSLSLIATIAGQQAATWQILATVALLSSLFSLVCSFHLGYEVLFVTAMVLKGVGIPADQAYAVVVLLPLLNGAGVLVDAAASALGAAYSSRLLKPYEPVAFRDKI